VTARDLITDLFWAFCEESAVRAAKRLGFELVRAGYRNEMRADLEDAAETISEQHKALNAVRPLLHDLKWGRTPAKSFIDLAHFYVFDALHLPKDVDDGPVLKVDNGPKEVA
jgi:hypothetical protein